MKVITLKPKIEQRQTCCHCATVYMLEESDVTAKIRITKHFACDYDGEWKCPGCGKSVSIYLWQLPWSWRDAVLARSPGIDEEYKKFETERKARLNDESERDKLKIVQSRFDKFLKYFTLGK